MMKEIGGNEFYSMRVDKLKNRIHFQVKGQVSDPRLVPDMVRDMNAAIKMVTPGFTWLCDLRKLEMLIVRDSVEGVIGAAAAAGVGKVAAVWGKKILPKFEVHKAAGKAQAAGFTKNRKDFTDIDKALAWLDK
jgi:hypothetical protein